MNRIPVHPARALGAAALLLLAVVALAACGSSSPSAKTAASSTGPSSTGSKSATTPPPGTRPPTARFQALSACLKKQGVTLPGRVPGGKPTRPGTAGPLGIGGNLPNGVSRAKFQEALKKCGSLFPRGRFNGRVSSPAFKKSLERFAACMREQHINVPKANTSGKGPVFDSKGLNTGSASFKAAERKCAPLLRIVRPGGSGGAPPSGAPPAEG